MKCFGECEVARNKSDAFVSGPVTCSQSSCLPKTPVCGVEQDVNYPTTYHAGKTDSTTDAKSCKAFCRGVANATYFTWFDPIRSGYSCVCKSRVDDGTNSTDYATVSGALFCDDSGENGSAK